MLGANLYGSKFNAVATDLVKMCKTDIVSNLLQVGRGKIAFKFRHSF